ncbi:MAG: lipase, partial [Prevotella sp.]|nr:lipase [Prevotella sp.]MDY4732261.1 lipase [Prevotella sp.]
MKRTGRNKRSIATLVVLLLSMIVVARGKRVLFIGDSITDGAWGNSKVWNTPSDQRNHKDMNHIYGHGYMMITASHYEALYPEAGWTFWNRGISGNTLDDL